MIPEFAQRFPHLQPERLHGGRLHYNLIHGDNKINSPPRPEVGSRSKVEARNHSRSMECSFV